MYGNLEIEQHRLHAEVTEAPSMGWSWVTKAHKVGQAVSYCPQCGASKTRRSKFCHNCNAQKSRERVSVVETCKCGGKKNRGAKMCKECSKQYRKLLFETEGKRGY